MRRINYLILAILMLNQSSQVIAQNKVKLPAPSFMNEQLSAQLLNQTLALSDPALVKAQAELLRQHYQALIEAGFDKDEALQLVTAIASRDKS